MGKEVNARTDFPDQRFPGTIADPPGRAAAPVVDEDRFSQLMEMVGPQAQSELLGHFVADLCRLRDVLPKALSRRDHGDLRERAHVLVALAGSIGAFRLEHLAHALNHAGRARDDLDLASLGPAVLQETARLIDYCAAASQQRGWLA